MANRTKFAGFYRALDYFYGGPNVNNSPGALTLVTAGPNPAGAGTVFLSSGIAILSDGTQMAPLNTNAPVLVGSGSNQESVTPSGTTNPTLQAPGSAGFTATFANVHGFGDPVASATAGLQEAINDAHTNGGGVVVVDAGWTAAGGTTAMIIAATFPSDVGILDNRAGGGGAGVINAATITITNAAFKASNTTPVPVLAAPGAGNMYDIIDMVAENKSGGAAYANGGVSALYYGTSSAGVLASATIAASFFTSPTVAHVIRVAGALADTAGTSILNAGVVFTNPTADFITGTGTVILKVFYRTLTGL